MADGLVLRLGEPAVAVAHRQLRQRCDEALMGLRVLSGDSPEAPARKPKIALRLRLNDTASPARLGLASPRHSGLPLAQPCL